MARPRIAITQRVVLDAKTGERRDALDQSWAKFLDACGATPLILPNHRDIALEVVRGSDVSGILLTGGNDLGGYGGTAPERDQTESALLQLALSGGMPLAGVCRGMQLIQDHFGVKLKRITGHVQAQQAIEIDGRAENVNSYHEFGTTDTTPELQVWARSSDGVIKAIRHRGAILSAMMWHPERLNPFAPRDIQWFRNFFGLK